MSKLKLFLDKLLTEATWTVSRYLKRKGKKELVVPKQGNVNKSS